MKDVVERTEGYVRGVLEGDSSGHDWWHVERVRKMAGRLAEEEGADGVVVELAALLHDVADWKFHEGDEKAGSRVAREWLESQQVGEEVIAHVCEIIDGLSFKGAGVPTPMRTVEGQIVQDADRLDAIGAVGIARTFAYGGHKGQPIHLPDQAPQAHQSFADYKASRTTTVNHFYEKLLLLRERMNTASARRVAQERHEYLAAFLERFLAEWEGKSYRMDLWRG